MTAARVEKVYADGSPASEFLDQAETFFAGATGGDVSATSKMVLLHNAVVSACDAALQSAGLRGTPGDGAHVVRIETALDTFSVATEDLFERLDAARERPNEASSRAEIAAQASVTDAEEATSELLALVRAALR